MKHGYEYPPKIDPLPGYVWKPLEDFFKKAEEIPDGLFITFYSRDHDAFGIGVTKKTGPERRQASYMVWARWSGRASGEVTKKGKRDIFSYVEGGRLIEPTHAGWMNLDCAFVMVRKSDDQDIDKELNDAFI